MRTGKDGKLMLILDNNTIASEKREVTEKKFDKNIFCFPETEEGLKCGTLCWGLEHLILNIYFVLFLCTICRGKKHCTKNLLFILAYTALFCRCWILMKVKLIYCVLSLPKVLWLKSQHWSKNPLIEILTQRETENT